MWLKKLLIEINFLCNEHDTRYMIKKYTQLTKIIVKIKLIGSYKTSSLISNKIHAIIEKVNPKNIGEKDDTFMLLTIGARFLTKSFETDHEQTEAIINEYPIPYS